MLKHLSAVTRIMLLHGLSYSVHRLIPPPVSAPVRASAQPPIRHESFGLETYSPYQDKDLEDISVFDCGDLELCFGSAESALADIEKTAAQIVNDNKLPLLIGGEHLVTLANVRAVLAKYPGLHIIHFDAHADLRDDYLDAKLSHACVMRRCFDLVGDGRIHQFCIRSGERSEFAFAKEHTDMHPFDFDGLEALTAQLKKDNTPVYLTVDLDCLDPSVFPGTGTPEAGGVTFRSFLLPCCSSAGQMS